MLFLNYFNSFYTIIALNKHVSTKMGPCVVWELYETSTVRILPKKLNIFLFFFKSQPYKILLSSGNLCGTIHPVLCNDGFTAWSSISQMKILSAKKNPTSWPHQETLIWNLKQKSNNIPSPFFKSPTCLASSAIRSHLSHQLTKTQGSLPQPVSWGGCLPSILAYRAQASSKGGMNYGLVQPRGFFFIPYPPPSVHGTVFFSRLQLPHQKLVFPMMDPFQFIRDRGNKNICYDFRLGAKQLWFQRTGV